MYSRHDLVWLTSDGWAAAETQVQGRDLDAVERWRREDWPAIVRRRDTGAAPDTVGAGIALPPDSRDGSKRRIALSLEHSHVARHRPPLRLDDVRVAAPAAWREQLDRLASEVSLRTYGSLALQAITGMQYLRPCSDIDLLFCPGTRAELDAGIDALCSHARHMPLDGEVLFPSGEAVAWKEWRAAWSVRGRVLVKSINAVRLADTAHLAATLEATG